MIDHLENPTRFGPWASDIDPIERRCRWRAFAALALVYAGTDSALAIATREAEKIPAAAETAWAALLALPPLQRRRLLSVYGALNAGIVISEPHGERP
jgi:hypothetical protein